MENYKKSALVMVVAIIMVMLIILNFAAFLGLLISTYSDEIDMGRLFINYIKRFIMLAIQVCAFILLLAIKKQETPFNFKNVRLLKIISIMFLGIELLDFIPKLIPMSIELLDGTTLTVTPFSIPSGYMLAVGIVVYCLSIVFKHGITLQIQSDETL